jgi:hypothetical protein
MVKELLAIGGPKHGEWLPYYGRGEMIVPVAPKIQKIKEFDPNEMIDMRTDVVRYRIEYIGDPETMRRATVYVEQSISNEHALELLKEFLLKAFINMEDKGNGTSS